MSTDHHKPVPRRTWALWLGAVLLVPLTAASGFMVYALYLHAVTGQLTTVSKGYGATSGTIRYADSPVWFCVFFLNTPLAAMIIAVPVVLARLLISRMRSPAASPPEDR